MTTPSTTPDGLPPRTPIGPPLAGPRGRALRAAFRALDAVAPGVAAQRAADLWCTPPAGAGRRKDNRPRPGTLVEVTTARGTRVVAETWGEGPVVHLVHGWGGWRGQLGAFVDPLVEAGHRVVAADAPGHGDSGPGVLGRGRANATDLVGMLEATAAVFGPAAGVVAHSLGCTAAAVTAQKRDLGRLVLIAPNEDFLAISHRFAGLLGLSEGTRLRLVEALERGAGRPITDYDLGPLGAGGALGSPVVVHDEHDRETDVAVGRRHAAAWPGARFHATSGLGHHRILLDPDVVRLAVGHIRGDELADGAGAGAGGHAAPLTTGPAAPRA